MAKLIVVVNGKGGVGKSTASANIAQSIARKGNRTAVCETDSQESINNQIEEAQRDFDVVQLESEKEVYGVRRALAAYDYVIIDGAAAISAISAAAVMIADIVIIPVTPSPLDFSATGAILAVVEARADMARPVPTRFLITKKVNNSAMLRVLRDSLADTGYETLKVGMTQRQSYIKTMLDGGTIYAGDDSQAKGEVDLITEEILRILNEGN